MDSLHAVSHLGVNRDRRRTGGAGTALMLIDVLTARPGMNETVPSAALASADAREQFVQLHLRRIYLQIYRMVGNQDDAQDLTQEVFIKALQRSDQIKEPAKAAHWLSRIASNAAIDHLRRRGRSEFSSVDDLAEPLSTEPEESPENSAIRTEQRTTLEAGLRRLSERERTALVLRDVEGLPAEEVARHLKCSKATVRSHIANARIKFRRYLERRGDLR
jgi:RNA polymerase sigma-70 factor, ECF subfamily